MEKKAFAVITGDLVNSSGIAGNYKEKLEEIVHDVKQHLDAGFMFEIYRGDSFQGLVSDPAKALLIGILIRTGLRRNTRGKGLENSWDARIAIGIGEIEPSGITPETKIGVLGGPAFVRSGKAIDSMKNEGAMLKISTGNEQLDGEFAAICPLADTVINRWSTAQAEAIFIYLLENITQKEIGRRLKKSQRAISKRLESGNIEKMKPFFGRYKNVIAWKFNK